MRKKLISCLVVALSIVMNTYSQQTPSGNNGKKPNIIFFLVDDLGWMDVAYNGSKFYETPNIDKLAKEGVKFNRAYAACHVCSPTRASILTGKYPARINLTDWLPGRKDFAFQKLKNAEVNQALPAQETTLAEALKQNGYHTALFGKWHLGEAGSTPLEHGFDVRFPDWNAGWPLSYYPPYKLKGLEEAPKDEYLTDRMTTEAIKYIDANKDHPFFLYMSHFAVHDPIEGRPDLVKKYEKKLQGMKKPDGPPFILEDNPDTTHPLSRSELNALLKDKEYAGFKYLPNRTIKIKQFQDNVQFAAMVEAMDESLGRLLAKLKELKIEDNTIVIFVSDNGGMSGANFGKPDRVISPNNLDKAFSTSNLPLRGAKGFFYEGGIRVPLIIKWPAGKKGTQTDVPVISTDYYPTILQMAGLPLLPQQHVDGKSLVPLLTGNGKMDQRALYWHFPHYSNHGQQSPGGAIRYGDFKLLEYYENNTVQLFNLAKDPGEQNDISKTDPAKAKELTNMLHEWRNSVSAKMMAPNPDYTGK